MPPDRMDLLRGLYRDWNESGVDAMLERWFAPDVAWHDFPEAPDAQTHRGTDAVAAHLRSLMAVVGHWKVSVEDVVETEDGALVELGVRLQGEASGAGVDTTVFHVVALDDQRVEHVRTFLTREQALEAAGLPA